MENLYVSRFSYFFRSTKGVFLAYSSKTNSFIELSEPLYNLLKKCQVKETPINNAILGNHLETLCQEGFVGLKDSDDNFVLESQFSTQTVQYDTTKLNLVLVPTLNCNFACPYCFETGKGGGVMSDDTINELLEFITNNNGKDNMSITWYGGEPLLGLNAIKKILNGLKRTGCTLNHHSIITNGYYLDEKVLEFFAAYPLDSIQITLDGQEVRHNKLRAMKETKAPTFKTILEHIKLVAEKMPETSLHIRVNIDKNNAEDYYSLCTEIKNMINSNNVTVYPGIIRLENDEITNIVEPAFGRWEAANFLYDIYSKGFLKGEVYPTKFVAKVCCASCINSFIIGPHGEIYKCWNDVSDKAKIIGYINKNGIKNKELYFRYHVGCEWYNDIECKKCFFLPICNGKCAWYNERNIYHNGKFNLCQCMQKAPGLLDKCLENYYNSLNGI